MMLLTVKDLVGRLQIKPSTLYAWAAQGKIPCLKVNGVIRFDADTIDRWLEGCRVRPGADAFSSNGKRQGSRSEIDRAIARAKRAVYTPRHGETNPTASPIGKEELWGS